MQLKDFHFLGKEGSSDPGDLFIISYLGRTHVKLDTPDSSGCWLSIFWWTVRGHEWENS